MDPDVWGPPLWDLLFTLCFKCPDDQACREDLKHVFHLLEKVIPCPHCRRSYVVYRKEVKPASAIRPDVPHSAAMWLWTIHDMVNQKLGKVCVTFEKLTKKHASFFSITNDFVVLDLFCIVFAGCKAASRPAAADFVRVCTRLLRHVPHLRLPSAMPSEAAAYAPERMMDVLHAAHEALCEAHGIRCQTRDETAARYALAYA